MEKFIDRHSLALRKRDLLYPLIKKWKSGDVVASLAAGAGAGGIAGNPVAGIAGAVATQLVDVLRQLGIDRIRAIWHPFHSKFDFHPDDYVLLTGFKKDYEKRLITKTFDLIVKVAGAKPDVSENDKALSDMLVKVLGEFKAQRLYSREGLDDKEDQFMTTMLQKDILSVGGPIPIDPLYEVMVGGDRLPCNYKLKDFGSEDIYPPGITGMPDKTLPKYPVLIAGRKEPLYPEWNELNWGIITCVDKEIIFDERKYGKVKGLFFNVSGCQWFGSHGAGLQLLSKGGTEHLADYVEKKIGTLRNFQVIIKVYIDPQTKSITKFELKDAFKVKG